MKLALALMATGFALASCGPPAEDHDKAYYSANPQARAKTLARCRNDPGAMSAQPDCVNAIGSDADAEHQRVFHTSAPPSQGVTNAGHL